MSEPGTPTRQEAPAPGRAHEDRYRTIFENSPVSIWEEDFSGVKVLLDGLRASGVEDLRAHLLARPEDVRRCAEAVRVLDVNAATLALHGARSKAELIGDLLATFTPESLDNFREELVALWEGRTAYTSEGVVRTLAGERRVVTVLFNVCPGHEQTLSRVFVSLVDVTGQRQAEDAIRLAERRYREIFENTQDVMYVLEVSADGEHFRNLDVNPEFERAIGLTAAQVVGKLQEEVVPAEVARTVNAKYRRCVESGHQLRETAVLELPTGRRTFESTLIPVRDEQGRVYRIVGISRDVTGHRRDLEEIEDLYNNAPCGYHSLDADGRYVRVNDVELQWLGYAREEVVGKLRFGELLAPGSVERFARTFPLFKERGFIRDLEFELVRKDGTTLPVMLSATAIRDPAGRYVMSRTTLVDLSERRRVEAQLRQAQKLEAVARLASGVAHDFNNVLTIIMTASRDVLDTIGEGHPLREDVLEIDGAAQRAAALTRQLLTFSREQPLEPRVLDLDQVVAGMERMLRRIIGEDVELLTGSDGAPHRVRADPGQLEQALLNLAVNARDAMPGGGKLTVETRAVPGGCDAPAGTEPGDRVLLTVRDTGTGMPPDVLAHLFEPFFSTKPRGKGTGLGLSTVYGIVKQCGGQIRVESTPGQGSTFLVYLPATVEEVPAGPVDPPSQTLPRGSEKVLVAEDDPRVRTLLARTLRGLGYSVVEARDGEEALRLSTAEPPLALLVTDAVMPRMGGRELAERLRATRPDAPVLFVSGYSDRDETPPAGPRDGFLEKPFTAGNLARRVRELLDRRGG